MPGYPLPLQLFCFHPLKLVTVANIHHFVRLTPHLTVGSLNYQQDWLMRQAIFLHPRYTPGAFQKKYANFEVDALTYLWASNVKMDVANRSVMFVSWWNNVNFWIKKKSVNFFFCTSPQIKNRKWPNKCSLYLNCQYMFSPLLCVRSYYYKWPQ